MTSRIPAAPIFRAQLRSRTANGHSVFVPQCRKVVFEYCDKWPTSASTRSYIQKRLVTMAQENPHCEFVVKQRNQKEPIIRGFYLNNREKVIPLQKFDFNGIEKKVQLLLDSSGNKIVSLKKRVVVSTTEATRGIWSGLHDRPFKI